MKTIKKNIITIMGLLTLIFFSSAAYSQECGNTVLCAKFVKQSVDLTMTASTTQTVLIRFKNQGSAAWSSANIDLKYIDVRMNPENNNVWGIERIAMQTPNVAVGEETSFEFTITAPSAPGTYNFQWELEQSGQLFGSPSAPTLITVR